MYEGIPTFHHGMIPIRENEEEQGPSLDKYQQYQRLENVELVDFCHILNAKRLG